MIQNPDKSRLAAHYFDLFNMVMKMRIANDFGEKTVFRDKVRDMLNQTEMKAQQNGVSVTETEQAKFALVAMVDEFVITSDWEHKESWMANPWQMELYNRFDAGEEFFKKLRGFLSSPGQNSAVLEIYYICLCLGFKGKYAIGEHEQLRSIIKECYKELKNTINGYSDSLASHVLPEGPGLRGVQQKVPFWYFGVGLLFLGLAFYFIITLLSRHAVENAVDFLL